MKPEALFSRGPMEWGNIPDPGSLTPDQCNALITAAGLSSRMGFPKALLDWLGKPLLQHQIDVLRDFGRTVVVLGHDARRIRLSVTFPPPVRVVENPDYESGRASSIHCGLREVDPTARAILICGVDQPLERAVVAALVAAFDPARLAYAVPTHEGRRGHPVLFSAELLPELESVREETEGLRVVVRKHRQRSLEVPVPSPGILRDLNRPEDR